MSNQEFADLEEKKADLEKKKVECEKQGMVIVDGDCKERWSPYMGDMNWDSANAKCRSIGMRLPTIDELKDAYSAGITKSWQKYGYDYLSSTPYDAESYYVLNVNNGNTYHNNRYTYNYVRCRR